MMTATRKQTPMLFKDRLVRAILDGTKTQTRRTIKPQPEHGCGPCHWTPTGWAKLDADGACRCKPVQGYHVGNLLWVRETWATTEQAGHHHVDAWPVYKATDPDWSTMEGWKWRPSIHMPKWACRIWLEITDVRVQRIQEISEADAKAEGILDGGCINCGQSSLTKPECCDTPAPSFRDSFCYEWKQIYPGSWERNDWVWALTFKRTEASQ